MNEIQKKINDVFVESFGRTPLKQRLSDIDGENRELQRFLDVKNLKEELGDLLCSSIQLANECEWDVEELIKNTLDKIGRRKNQYASLGRKIKVAVFGGSFNPPHIGHFNAAKVILDSAGKFDEVWFLPCYKSLYGKQLEDAEHRLAMCEIFAKLDGRMKSWDYEIKHSFSGETFQFLKMLYEEDFAKNTYDFSFVIGMDNALLIDKWVNADLLLNMAKFVVVSRPGYDFDVSKAWFINSPDHVYIENEESEIEISSTKIRNILSGKEEGDLVDALLPDVLQYIKDNKLYGL